MSSLWAQGCPSVPGYLRGRHSFAHWQRKSATRAMICSGPLNSMRIDAAVMRVINRIIHEPVTALKAESRSRRPIDVARIVREVYRLDEHEQTEAESP